MAHLHGVDGRLWRRCESCRQTTAPPVAEDGVPAGALPSLNPAADTLPQTPGVAAEPPAPAGELIRVRTDVLDVRIASQGGDLVRADLLQYPVHKDMPEPVVRLLDDSGPERWVFASGLRSAVGGAEPNHLATFRTASNEYSLAPGQDELVVTLDWVGEGPISARKTYTFRRGQYEVDLTLTVSPAAGGSWRGAPYVQMERVHVPVERSYLSIDSYSVKGPVLYDGEQFEKLDVEDIARTPGDEKRAGRLVRRNPAPLSRRGRAARHRCLPLRRSHARPGVRPERASAPSSTSMLRCRSMRRSSCSSARSFRNNCRASAASSSAPSITASRPRSHSRCSSCSNWVHGWVGNWGFAIIIVTILIKLVFYKLTAMSGRSMAKMRKIAPRMKALQERYKDDRQGLSQAMMELYKREKVNPAAGCLPILIQMPFFFAFYWMLVESVEMRQAPFALWIDDLSAQDPFYVLPVVDGGRHVLPNAPESCATRSGASAHDADHADRVRRSARVLPGRPRPVPVDEHGVVDLAAVAHQHDRGARVGSHLTRAR